MDYLQGILGGGSPVGTVPTGSVSGGGVFQPSINEVKAGIQGQVSLALLDFIILGFIAWYYFTRKYQGE